MPSLVKWNAVNKPDATWLAMALKNPATIEAIDAELARRQPEIEASIRRFKQAEIISEKIRKLRVNI